MDRFFLFLLLFLACGFHMEGQLWADTTQDRSLNAAPVLNFDYGNDWYDPSLYWLKFKVWEDGVYRVSSNELQSAGMILSSIDPDRIHLYYRGKEVPIYVDHTAGLLNYIEFYGRRNDGRVDSIMYRDPGYPTGGGVHKPDLAPNKRISLFSDTSAYFFTQDQNLGLRAQTFYNTNYQSYSPEPHFRYEAYKEYHPEISGTGFSHGGGTRYDSFYLLNSDYITGEGYMHGSTFSNSAAGGISRVFTLSTKYSANAGPHELTGRVFSRSTGEHIVQIRAEGVSTGSGVGVILDTTGGVGIKTHQADFNWSLPNSTRMRFYARGGNSATNFTDNNNICWGAIKYDRLFHMDNQPTLVVSDWNKTSDAFFAFEKSNINQKAWVWDLKYMVRVEADRAGSDSLYAIIPGRPESRDLYIATDNGLKSPQIEPNTSFGNLSGAGDGADFVIITHRSLASSAIAYKNYRDTCSVNQLSAKIVFVDQIYEEFGYGSQTPWAIKRFCKYAIDHWTNGPKFFLLWGKGQYLIRKKTNNFVPTYGYPACDWEYVSNFDSEASNLIPEVPIGRVNIYNNTEGLNYLAKVDEYEHAPWEPWMKEMVFLGGGENSAEQQPIFSALLGYKNAVENLPLGGKGFYFQKSDQAIETNSILTSSDHINRGVSLIHFFGHSSSNIFDIDIQLPSLYSNYGKIPLMVAFGCYGGEFTGDDKSFGEKFILEKDRGSIGYLANSTAGFLNELKRYGGKFYPHVFGSELGQPIGIAIQEAMRDFSSTFRSQLSNNHVKQLNYQGDPAVTLYYPQLPDLEITESSIYFEPENFSASDDSFFVQIITNNLGLGLQDSFWVSIRQETPSGNVIVHPSVLHRRVTYSDTIRYTLINTIGNGIAGQNTFDIFVDSTNVIAELNEDNNRVSMQVTIPGDVPAILHPIEYAVIDSANTWLAASAFTISDRPEESYVYQIDTVPEFNSPAFQNSGLVQGSANYVRWEVPTQLNPNTVYYWRVRLADIYPVAWATSSFKYIPGKTGWAQTEPMQFTKNQTTDIRMNELQRTWEFEQKLNQLSVFNILGTNEMQFRLEGFRSKSPGDYLNRAGVHYCVIDQYTLEPTIQGTIMGDWVYSPTPVNVQQLVTAISSAQTGDFVLICSVNDHNMQSWSPSAIQALYQIGCSSNIENLSGDDMFIILGRKGFPGSAVEVLSPNERVSDGNGGMIEFFDININMEGSSGEGKIESTLVGPSTEWGELIWDWSSLDPFINESVSLDVYGVRHNNTDSLILSDLSQGTYDLSGIDHNSFPYLKLVADGTDIVRYTAPQLDRWLVLYEAAPDALADPATHFTFLSDTVNEGEDVRMEMLTRNITSQDMDSLLVRYSLLRADRSEVELGEQRYAPLQGDGQLALPYTFNSGSKNLGGETTFRIEINPDDDQVEQYHFNNSYQYKFYVKEDQVSPLLDVTVDGKHLMDRDIVSPNPEILIEINDENPYLKVNDTGCIVRFGKTSLSGTLPLIFLQGNPVIELLPAELPENKARIYFRPEDLEDGFYTLQVNGYDANGNASGGAEYEIQFEVVNESSVSHVLNYPNPFSTSTEFVYTLTGSVIPDVFRIDIFTITGIQVKSIDLSGMGEVGTGYQRTEYKWDGRDEYGDLLANGVYLYKVTVKNQGVPLIFRDEGVNNYFKQGFGKMYIMR